MYSRYCTIRGITNILGVEYFENSLARIHFQEFSMISMEILQQATICEKDEYDSR